MKQTDYSLPANILGDEAIDEISNIAMERLELGYFPHSVAVNLAIHQYERLKEVCPSYTHEMKFDEIKRELIYTGFDETNPTYTKIVEVLAYLNSLK